MITPPDDTNLGPFSASDAELIDWETTVDALRRIQKYFVTTVRPDGRPHVTPLLATTALDGFCFASGEKEVKSKNLRANPHCILATGVAGLTGTDYVIEGAVAPVADEGRRSEAATVFETNFGWHITDPEGSWHGMGDWIRKGEVVLYELLPAKAFAYWNGNAFAETRYVWSARTAS